MMEQVVLNLALNSRDAMPKGGGLSSAPPFRTLTPLSSPQSRGPPRPLRLPERQPTTAAAFRPDILPHSSSRFSPPRKSARAPASGLATVYGIAKQHKGWVEVESEPGKGATFKIYLPADGNPSSAANPLASATTTIAA